MKTKAFNSSFYPYSVKEWCALSEKIRNIVSVNKFREIILSFIRPNENSVFAIHDTKGLKLLKRFRLNISNLNEHKFRHGFRDTVDSICRCGLETAAALHFLLSCRPLNYPDKKLLNILLYGPKYFTVKTNQSILKSAIKFLKSSERFDGPLFLYNEK